MIFFLSHNLVSSDLSIWLLEKIPLLFGKQFQTGLISHEINASDLHSLNMHLIVQYKMTLTAFQIVLIF